MLLYFGVVDLSGFGSAVRSKRTADSNKMARVCVVAFIAGFLLEVYGLPVEIPPENTGKESRFGFRKQLKVGDER